MEVLVEVHSHFEDQIAIAAQVDRVYDFALPPLVLHALYSGDVAALARWFDVRPTNAVTVLDTHDGIGIIDVGPGADDTGAIRAGLLSPDQIGALVEGIHHRTTGESQLATGAAASNLDLYQVNSTFYDALGRDDHAYLLARALQLFVPGVPQVYYVGALAGENDVDLLRSTGVGRDINRHRFTAQEVAERSQRPVVRSLLQLCRLRSSLPAFDGEFSFEARGSGLVLAWRTTPECHGVSSFARLEADVRSARTRLTWGTDDDAFEVHDLLNPWWLDTDAVGRTGATSDPAGMVSSEPGGASAA
jgi:sucrose phosphorylase